MDENAGLYVKVKQEYCTEVSIDQENDGYQGVAQISQSSYSASINLAHKALRMKEEQDTAMETPPDFGFSVVDVNRVQWLEPGQTPEVDPLQLSSPPIKDEPPLGLQETLFVDVKREPESQEFPGDQELCPWNADESVFEPHVSIEESVDLVTATDVISRVNPEGQDSAVTGEEGPSGLGRSSREGDSTSLMTLPTGAEPFRHDFRENDSVIGLEVPVQQKQPILGLIVKTFTCEICEIKFNDNLKFTRHMKSHDGNKPHVCEICKSRFTLKSYLYMHMRTHTGVKPHCCEVCKAKFSQKSSLNTHMRTHTGEKPYSCEVCKTSFSSKQSLSSHMSTHTGVKAFACDLCQSTFSHNATLLAHRARHFGLKPFACDICKACFSIKSNLQSHMKTHTTSGKPFVCNICNACFAHKSYLRLHMKRIHKGV